MHCEYIIEIDMVLMFPLIALSHRVIASHLCERTFKHDFLTILLGVWLIIKKETLEYCKNVAESYFDLFQ